jgi:ABC-type sugar transport system ATPase subunit
MSSDPDVNDTFTEFSSGSRAAPLLEMRQIRKAFPGVLAIDNASLELLPGEIHALVGENGAGKSTLIKILNGIYPADSGDIILNGKKTHFSSPPHAMGAGIATIYQEFTLIPTLPVTANLFLGREKTKLFMIDCARELEAAQALFESLDLRLNARTLVSELTVSQQQMVEIARALSSEAVILVMDEPTAALTPREVEKLFEILARMKSNGISIIFVSHRLDEVFRIADRITVMRDGKTIMTALTTEFTKASLIEQMVGRPLDREFPKRTSVIGDVRLEIKELCGSAVRGISLSVKRGEVLGITGLMGAGRTELARLIFGADKKESGQIILDGKLLEIKNPRQAIRHGICLLTEDRKSQGLILMASAIENFALPNLPNWCKLGVVDRRLESSRFLERVNNLDIRVTGPDQRARDLSGGNQQKLLVARWLETESQVILFDEPTRGIDVGAKFEMYLLINELADQGKAVILISSELPEVLGICDRILVMKAGRIAGEIDDISRASQESIMALAV